MRKAKTYEGKTLSWRGLHSKTLRGCDWAVAAIRNVDITFLNRVPRRDVDELVFVHPNSVLDGDPDRDVAARTRGQVRAEFVAQLGRARHKAAKHSAISVALFAPAVVVDTFAVVIWPFGGLAEIDAVWAYVSLSGWLTARSVTRRLADAPTAAEEAAAEEEEREERERQRQRQEGDADADASPRTRAMRQVRFRENLEDRDDDEDEQDLKMGGVGGKDRSKRGKGSLKVRFVPDAAMGTMESYFQEACHRRNPRAFKSPGVPPTQTDVLASIGWFPDRRGRAPGVERSEDWSDESVSYILHPPPLFPFSPSFSSASLSLSLSLPVSLSTPTPPKYLCTRWLTVRETVANPADQGGSRQGHEEGRQAVGQVVQVLRQVPRASHEGEGPQRHVGGDEETAHQEGYASHQHIAVGVR